MLPPVAALLFFAASVLKALLALAGVWVCFRYRRLSPWMWCILLGLVGVLWQAGIAVLMSLQEIMPLFEGPPDSPFPEGALFWWVGLASVLGEFVGLVGELVLLMGLPFLVRDLVRQFQLWKDLQSGTSLSATAGDGRV